MKKRLFLLSFLLLFFLNGCSSAKDLSDYVEVSFEGIDTRGTAYHYVSYDKIYEEVLNYKGTASSPDQEIQDQMMDIESSYEIKLDKMDNLKNGDTVKVTVTVNKDKTKKVKSGEKTIKVTGLDEPKILTNEDVEKNLVVNFNGVSGRGESQIDNIFDSPLDLIDFTFENDGELKNNDKAKVVISKEEEDLLLQNGYLLAEDFSPVFEVKGLDIVADNASNIANIDDITRMIDEGIKREYQSSETNEYSWDTRYEITEEKLMYRAFRKETNNDQGAQAWYYDGTDNGNLVKVFTVKSFSGGAEGKLIETQTVIYGFTDIILDDNNEANVAELTAIEETKDDTYSLESILKLYQGYGYTEV